MNSIEFSRNLFLLRREHSMSMEDVASALDVPEELVCEWECAKTSPSLDQMNRLAKLYGIPLEEIVRSPKPHNEEILSEIPPETALQPITEPEEEPEETETEIPEPPKEKTMSWWEILVIVLLILIIGAGVFFLVRPEWFPLKDLFGSVRWAAEFLLRR